MSQPSEAAIKPCPWCRGKAKCNELRRGNYRREGDNYQVVCNKCRARGPLVQDSPTKAIAAWNRRIEAEAKVEPVACGIAPRFEHRPVKIAQVDMRTKP